MRMSRHFTHIFRKHSAWPRSCYYYTFVFFSDPPFDDLLASSTAVLIPITILSDFDWIGEY